jgi:hypothetical protein
MARVRWYHYFIILLVFLVLGTLAGTPVEPPGTNRFFSWVLIGVWMIFSLKLVDSAFNSMQNHAIFVFGTNFIALIFSTWGNFSTLLNESIVDLPVSWIQVSPWTLLFSVPYLFYGTYAVFACFRKYFFVYIGGKSVSSRKFGVFVIIFNVMFEATYLAFLFSYTGTMDIGLDVVSRHVDPFMVLFVLVSIAIAGRYARTPSIPDITTPVPAPARARPQPQLAAPRPAPRPAPAAHTSNTAAATRPVNVRTVTPQSVRIERINIDELRPKAGVLSREDFKCIFCFNLPKIPDDEHRGVVICPTCKHPAHADEFKEWIRSSSLCSRCDAKIPPSFRKKPKIVSVKVYLDAMKQLSSQIKG